MGILGFAYIGGLEVDAAEAVIQKTVEAVAANPKLSSSQYKGMVSKAGVDLKNAVAKQLTMQKKKGRPERYTKQIGDIIIKRISNGETLKSICQDMKIEFGAIMEWCDRHEEFGKGYRRARESMAVHLVEGMVENVAVLENDRALAARVQADVVRWVAQRFAPAQFSDSKRIELKGEITHTHIHDLPDHQKRKIAEAWLMSQQTDDSPGITSETTGPDLEAVAVREICEDEQGIVPKRKRTAPALPGPKGEKGKRGRPRKQVDLDQDLD